MTYLTGSFGHPLASVTKTNTKNQSRKVDAEGETYFILLSQSQIGSVWRHLTQTHKNKPTAWGKLARLFFMLAFSLAHVPHTPSLSSSFLQSHLLCFLCPVPVMSSSHCLHGSFWCVPVWLSGMVLTGRSLLDIQLCPTSLIIAAEQSGY